MRRPIGNTGDGGGGQAPANMTLVSSFQTSVRSIVPSVLHTLYLALFGPGT